MGMFSLSLLYTLGIIPKNDVSIYEWILEQQTLEISCDFLKAVAELGHEDTQRNNPHHAQRGMPSR